MRAIVFYPLVALAAAAMIWISLGPGAQAPPVTRQAGAPLAGGGAAFTARALSHVTRDAPEQVTYVAYAANGEPVGLRLAVKPELGEPSSAEQGVRLLLDPALAATLEATGARVEVDLKPIGVTTAAGLALSLQTVGAVEWVSQQLPPVAQTAVFELPPSFVGGAPEAIGFRPLTTIGGYAFGWEIVALRVRPL